MDCLAVYWLFDICCVADKGSFQEDTKMRKVRPQDVLSSYVTQVDQALAHYERVVAALKGTPNVKLDTTLMSRGLLHTVFVDFECFISDLFVAYLNRDFSQYQSTFENSVRQAAAQKHSSWLSNRITFNRPAHMKLDEIADAIDPTGWNMTFKSCSMMKDKARLWLAAPYAAKITSLDSEDENLVDTARALRNWIAHQSDGSGAIMNTMLADIEKGPGTSNHELGRGVNEIASVGAFLKSQVNGHSRAQIYARRLKEVANNLTI
ncbi:hypothetical protein ACTAB9_17415 [Pseudomonas syringae]|uniref:hypothetical protein n=1 Tax=Pseudomonas syringae TaxID=317 RepID=UPI003F7527BC